MMSHALPGNAITTDWSESDSTDLLFDNFEPQCTWKVKRKELIQRIFAHKNSPGMKLGKLDLSSCLQPWGGGGKGGGSGARPRHAPKLVLVLLPWGYDKDEGHNITLDVQVEMPRDYDRTIRSVCVVLCVTVTEMGEKNKAEKPFVLRKKAEIDLGRRATMAYGFLSHKVIRLSTCNHFAIAGSCKEQSDGLPSGAFQADPEEVGDGGSDSESKRVASHLQLQQGETHFTEGQ